MQHSVYLSLGSNIRPHENIPRALKAISEKLTLLQVSSAWVTKAVGTNGPDFLNLAVHVLTELDQPELKEEILGRIEDDLGRIRSADKYAPRTIDIDIILFDDQVIDSNLWKLDYLILPFSELIPDFLLPANGKPLIELAAEIRSRSSAIKLAKIPNSN